MALKQMIERAYKIWEKKSKEMVKDVDPKSSNYKEVFSNVKKLKEDLCKFADEFDKYTKMLSESYDKPLPQTLFDDMDKKIKENFVERIAKENKNFIYIEGKTKPLNETINEAQKAYSHLCELDEPVPQIMKSASGYFTSISSHIDPINGILVVFIGMLCKAMDIELNLKAKFLIAKDEEYFNDKKNSNLFSRKVVRRLFPSFWSQYKNRVKYGKHTIEKVKGDVKIFPKGKPLPSEVRQSGVGDCYLMASLIALAKTNPKAITDCFVQGLDKIENEDEINIRFFCKSNRESELKAPVIIRINKKKVISPKDIKGNALWPKLIEKAYAVYRKKGYDFSYRKNLHGGDSSDSMFAITGNRAKSSTRVSVSYSGVNNYEVVEKFTSENVISTIKKKLNKSRVLTCNFKKDFKIKDVKSQEKIEIFSNHAYAIVGINDSKKYIRLIEPNKFWGRKVKNSPKSQEGGHIAMSFDDFKKNFLNIDYTTGK